MLDSRLVAAMAAAGLVLAGCGSRGGKVIYVDPPAAAGTTTGASTSGSSNPPGTTTGGSGTGPVTGTISPPNPSSQVVAGPTVRITSPRRGEQTTANQVQLTGTVTDPSGVRGFTVNGRAATLGAGGAFNLPVSLDPGLNIIATEATGNAGGITLTHVSVLSGRYLVGTSPIPQAARVRLTDAALDALERPVEAFASTINLQPYLAQVGNQQIAFFSIQITGARFQSVDVELDSVNGGLAMGAAVQNLVVNATINGSPETISADRVEVNTTLGVSPAAGGQYSATVTGTRVNAVNLRMTGAFGFLLSTLQPLLLQQIANAINGQLPPQVAAQLAKATAPHTATVQGRTLTWQARPTAIAFDDLGVTADVEANVTMPAAAGAPASPGSLSTVGVPPTMGNQAGVQAAIDDDAVNRALWAAWQGGLTTLALDQATVAQIAGPNFPFRLEAALLTRFLPSLAGRLNPTDPVELDVSSLLPPVVRVTGTPDLVEMGMGEVATDIYVIEQGRRRLVLSVAAHVKVGASVGYSAGAVQVSFGNAPTVRANILASPVAAVDARNLESMLQTVLPSVLQLATGFGGGGRFPLPPIPGGLQVLNLRTYATGPALDYLGASFDLR